MKNCFKPLLVAYVLICQVQPMLAAESDQSGRHQPDFDSTRSIDLPGWQQMQQDYAEKAVIEKLYSSFKAQDGKGMAACYHPEASFEDPIFGQLKGAEIGAMWQMLLEISQGGLEIRYRDIDVSQGQGKAHWDADYHFSATGFPVHNQIDSRFEFKEGLIYRQQDSFNLHRWSAQALGLPGAVLGRTPFLQQALQKQVRERLKAWMQEHPQR